MKYDNIKTGVGKNMLQPKFTVTGKRLEDLRQRQPEQLYDYLPLRKTTDLNQISLGKDVYLKHQLRWSI
jgi:hypothetical protein